ncbi:MAG: endonuclease MutS2 [Bernardetiaceae bacterium]
MLYPHNIEQKIGFDQIRTRLKTLCQGKIGKTLVEAIHFHAKYETIQRLTQQTAEFLRIINSGLPFPNAYFLDVSDSLAQAKIENSYLSEQAFFDLKNSLQTLYDALRFFHEHQDQYPRLYELSEGIALPADLVEAIQRTIDEEGRLRNNASPELQDIRRKLQQTETGLRRKLEQLVRQYRREGWLPDDLDATIREGRMVIPIRAEHKRKLKGIVHDSSATGQTVYIEPEEILDINNEIKELFYEEKREIIRILTKLTNVLRPHVQSLQRSYRFLAKIDFVRAKARLAQQLQAINPDFERTKILDWRNAYHPLLKLAYAEQGKSIVPHSIHISPESRILLISGPNAGGKSVALKTVGLVQYMYQCGLLVPMDEGSKMGIFQDIFIDIGDEQSIENDLSTYSSHLTNMRYFLQFADKKSLCLIDEFGTGTEPQFGGAIAESILEQLVEQKCYGVITTHYANLKFFAENTPGITNAAMRFDVQNLEPLFRLEIGQPGSSFALEIAQKIGLPKSVIDSARERVGTSQVDIENILRNLEEEKKVFTEKNQKIIEREQQLEALLEKYKSLRKQLQDQRKEIMQQAREKADHILKEANRTIENTIRDIKESQAEKSRTQAARKDLEKFHRRLQHDQVQAEKAPVAVSAKQPQPATGTIAEGDWVQIKGQKAYGQVLKTQGEEITVGIGQLKTVVKRNRLQKLEESVLNERQAGRWLHGVDLWSRQLSFEPEIDLRGVRAEEAMSRVESLIDNAIMLNHIHLRIVHGKGNGILREVIRNTLRNFREVESFEDEHVERGGDGVTLVRMRG